ncbi:tetratricopeptide repeat protein [Polaribacter sp.]|nr:tetratricopeptide repeat protein [Polaribacter sp.]
MKNYLYLLCILLLASCSSSSNSPDFIEKATGRYLFNENEVIEIYFKDQVLLAKWRDFEDIKPIKVNDSSFYMKELNEKLIFVSEPAMHIELAPKTEHKGKKYNYRKLKADEKTLAELIETKNFDELSIRYQTIKKKDSLNYLVNAKTINSLGYKYLRNKDFDTAIEIFKINVILYPERSNSYDSLADGYLAQKDTAKAIENYKKALSINPENRSSRRKLKDITKK